MWEDEEIGAALREAGIAPDSPINILGVHTPVTEILANELAELNRVVAEVNGQLPYELAPLHLLPPKLWLTRLGGVLLKRLELSPYRPWNTIFFPVDALGSEALGLPVIPAGVSPEPKRDVLVIMESIIDMFAGRPSPEADGLSFMFAAIRENNPYLFPPDRADFSPEVRTARGNVRAFAFAHASTTIVSADTIVKCQKTVLAKPEIQLIA